MRNHEERINNYLNTQINNNNENNNENNKINYISNNSKQTIYKNNNNQNKPNNSRNKNNKNIKSKHCLLCKKDGHIIEECYYNPFNKNNKNKNTINKYNNNKNNINNKNKFHSYKINENNSEYSSDTNDDYINFTGNISVLKNNIKCNNLKTNNKYTTWIIDSGTGLNLTNNINQLNNIQNSNDKTIIYPNGTTDKINCSGTYYGSFKNNKFKLSNVHFAPNIKNNLISTHHILSLCNKIIMENINKKDRLQIINKDNNIIANIYANDENLFTFNTISNINNINVDIQSNNYDNYSKFNIHNVDYSLWHSRLGHFNNYNNIKEFIIKHTSFHNKKECPKCKISKLRRKPFSASDSFTTEPLELVHTDVVCKLETSFQGYNYYLTFLDDFSRKCWIYLLKNKSDVYDKFVEFYKLTSNLYNIQIKTFKSDNGTEYINKNVISFLNNHGIKFIHSIPGYPQQNGRAERLNQTINNCAKTLLNSAKLPLYFWDSAVQCAAFLYNSNPHSSINFKIPNELFFNKPVDISHFKVFGCKAFFFNNHKTNKFENNSKQGIFLGYPENSSGYRILDISTNSIITARDVYFMEDIPWYYYHFLFLIENY